MRKLIATLSTLVMLAGGVVATLAESATPATGALVCAQPFDPTVRYVVNTVCSKFGP
ncbi:MAG: hypothetical protein QOD07_2856 [Frankiaceae bacterium]|jgi:hypothetical protein|nr:hypothetical protein [Frankiaceae bacterium]